MLHKARTLRKVGSIMGKLKKLFLMLIFAVGAMFLLGGCGYKTIPDGTTGVITTDGVVQDEYLQATRWQEPGGDRTTLKLIDNKIQRADYPDEIEGQSKDDVIVYASSYSFSGRIGGGEKSVWLVKNVSLEGEEVRIKSIVPDSLVEGALKDALLEVEAKNVTKRVYVEPIFKRILQERLNEYFGYKKGDDTTLIVVNQVSIGNLRPEEEYDKELSRTQILTLRSENDKRQSELDLEKAKADAAVALEKEKAESEVKLAKAETEAKLAELEAKKEAAEWEILSKYFTSGELVELKKIDAFAANWDGEYHSDGLSGIMFKLDDGGSSKKE